MEEHIEPISLDDAASVEDFYRLSILVAGDNHLGPKGVFLVSRYEGIARTYFVTAGCFAV